MTEKILEVPLGPVGTCLKRRERILTKIRNDLFNRSQIRNFSKSVT